MNRGGDARRHCAILLAEDNPADSMLVRKALEEHGLLGELFVAEDGEKAIHFIQSLDKEPLIDCPHLVIIDRSLPRKSGREVLEAIRSSERCRHIPVVVLSSSDAQQDKVNAAGLGCKSVYPKAFASRRLPSARGDLQRDNWTDVLRVVAVMVGPQ